MEESTGGNGARRERLPEAWRLFLGPRSDELLEPILDALEASGDYCPRGGVFRAFELCEPDRARVVVLGQDPYHGEGEAHGLAFSVREGVKIPPSLRNIFKEIRTDLGWDAVPVSGDLSAWASQGVLMLNAMLSVKPNEAASHAHLGWQAWTDLVLEKISREKGDVVFVLWGGFAKKKAALLAPGALVISGAHPSPLSANRGGFFGGAYFSQVNELLGKRGLPLVDWGAIR